MSATPLADADKAFHVLLPEQNLSINGHEHDVINRDVGPLGLYRLQSGVEGWE
ncbi:hypothetical protein SHLA_81c000160 [Shinella sp. DD12]|uniref:hypothetical protein n=1 Tax=Shinella sp. TaxID=1870904 RepID=UPI0003C56251|nr:hypothetical protein [Shinella sp.]EYR79525.1 hypothetical protein SHLA_81c000160 [Shinella sp. DD12]MCW5712773.1 hypothetical protein [Shinella sp.]